MAKQDDGLFLLEVLVDKLMFVKSPCFSDKDFRTCVTVECPSVEPLELCDDDPEMCVANSGGPYVKNFHSGKSCLFSMKEADINSACSKFIIKITVFKSLPCGCLPTKIILGEANIDMTKEFVQARKKFLQDPNSISYQALKDTFRLMGSDGEHSGDIIMFLRISCFGKLIITKFHGSGGPPTLGTGTGSSVVDRSCNPPKQFQSPDDPCVCGAARAGQVVGKPGFGTCPIAKDPYDSMPCVDPDDPCFCSGPKLEGTEKMECRNTDKYCLHVPKGRSKQFEEIGSNIAGNELKIKVPASAAVIKKISQTNCAMQVPYIKGKTSGAPCMPPCGKNQISLAVPTQAVCCHGPQPAATQFTCTTEGCMTASKHGPAISRGDAKTEKNALQNKDCFVLKVAKTAMYGDRKCKVEFEVVAPKGPDKKLPIQKCNNKMQSDLNCECWVPRIKKTPKRKKLY